MGDDSALADLAASCILCRHGARARNWRRIRESTTMECKKTVNLERCNCSYPGCARKGVCCDCLAYHLKSRQLPACCFPDSAEATWDRSFEAFARAWKL